MKNERPRLALICSSLEPERDGVGDYTRLLAQALEERGAEVLLVGLDDPHVQVVSRGATGARSWVRCPARMAWAERLREFAKMLTDFGPDVASLQFVAYGHHPKGMSFELAHGLATVRGATQWHVMLHELWIGESTEYGWKNRLVGWVQRAGVVRLLEGLRPEAVHTSNPVWVELLRRAGFAARELPLFGNIAPEPGGVVEAKALLFDPEQRPRGREWQVGVFGTVHSQWRARESVAELLQVAERHGSAVRLVQLGLMGAEGQRRWEELREEFAGRCGFLSLGAQPAEVISGVLQVLDFGIATSPWALIGKSGTVAAMLDHQLPVWVPRDDWRLRKGETPEPTPHELLSRSLEAVVGRVVTGGRRSPDWRLGAVADQFLREAVCGGGGAMPFAEHHGGVPVATR